MQLELDHTVALHLRSRRVGSDEAVYQVIDLFSTAIARVAGRLPAISTAAEGQARPPARAAEDQDDHRHAAIQQHVDDAVAVLQSSSVGRQVSSVPSGKSIRGQCGLTWTSEGPCHAVAV